MCGCLEIKRDSQIVVYRLAMEEMETAEDLELAAEGELGLVQNVEEEKPPVEDKGADNQEDAPEPDPLAIPNLEPEPENSVFMQVDPPEPEVSAYTEPAKADVDMEDVGTFSDVLSELSELSD